MKAVHTIFDYLSNNDFNDEKIGRVLGEWHTPDGYGNIGGGAPPLARNGGPNAERISKMLFEEFAPADKECWVNMLGGTVLMHFPKVFELIRLCPTGAFESDPTKHHFVAHVLWVCEQVQVGVVDGHFNAEAALGELHSISASIKKKFVQDNHSFLPLATIQEVLTTEEGRDLVIDARTNLQMLNTLCKSAEAQVHATTSIQDKVDSLQLQVVQLQEQQQHQTVLIEHQTGVIQHLCGVVQNLTAHLLQHEQRTTPPVACQQQQPLLTAPTAYSTPPLSRARGPSRQSSTTPPPAHIPNTLRNITLDECFRKYFIEDWPRQFDTHAPTTEDSKSAAQYSTNKSKIIRAVSFLYLFLPNHIQPNPGYADPNFQLWKNDIKDK
mmetsp:Transcript_79196/g.181297  ORF Transcript_79196/g.181297 Transcript_79196/m.181297 type:complete len:381 (-) Transcript_79196:305-1447(-)